jgi:phosphate transport system substrate-binding protein
MRLFLTLFFSVVSLFLISSIYAEEATEVTFAGSTTVFPFMEKLTPLLKKQGIIAKVQAGGSSAGFKAAKAGIADFGMMSRELKKKEQPHVKTLIISLDWLVMITHKDAPFDNITHEEIVNLYTGKTKELNGYKINAIAKEAGRGTKTIFDHYFHLGKKAGHPIAKELVIIGPNGQAITTVAGDTHGLTMLSYSAVDAAIKQGEPIKMLTLDGVAGTPENVKNGKYTLQRSLNLVYTPNKAALADRIRKALSNDEARKILIDGGLQPTL